MIDLETYRELDVFCSALKFCSADHYFNIRRDSGEILDYQSDSYEDAEKSANAMYAIECDDDGIEHGELREEHADIVVYACVNDYHDHAQVASLGITLECTGYHGDAAEHTPRRI